jgi:hypothetical protein
MVNQVFWWGEIPEACQVSRDPITNAFVAGNGKWACMSPYTHSRVGIGLGTGRGQRFEKQEDGRWLKVAG